jgi:sulfoacetaldehyde dehydrogenase
VAARKRVARSYGHWAFTTVFTKLSSTGDAQADSTPAAGGRIRRRGPQNVSPAPQLGTELTIPRGGVTMTDSIPTLYARARRAFDAIEFWPQDRVDEMVAAVGWELQKDAVAREVVRLAMEAGLGVFEDKVAKQKNKVRGALWDMRSAKTCGVVEVDSVRGITKIAKPIGVVANIVPSTNPTATPSFLGLCLLKTRNAMIVSPHPATWRSTYRTVEYGRKALARIGAPADLFQCIAEPTHAAAAEIMAACDFTIATGGAALHKIAYAAGKPAHTVGAGNVVAIVDETVDVAAVAKKIARSKAFDNASGCSMENAVAVHNDVYEELLVALQAEGGYLCAPEERERLRHTLWPDGRALNREIVARSARQIAALAGLGVPETTRLLMVTGERIGAEDRFSGEKVSPVLTLWTWSDFDEILARVGRILKFSGEGHSAAIHSERADRALAVALRLNVGRVSHNLPHAFTNSGGWASGQPVTVSLGGGTWAGNMTSDNINWRHFLNYTWLASPIAEYVPTDEELFGEYLSKWGRE